MCLSWPRFTGAKGEHPDFEAWVKGERGTDEEGKR